MLPMSGQKASTVFAKVLSTSGLYGCYWLYSAGKSYKIISGKTIGLALILLLVCYAIAFVYIFSKGLSAENQSSFSRFMFWTTLLVISLYIYFSWVAISLARLLNGYVHENDFSEISTISIGRVVVLTVIGFISSALLQAYINEIVDYQSSS